jgi:predicted PurR-regulated permease PerM
MIPISNLNLSSTTRWGVNILLLFAGVLALNLAQSVIIPLLIALILAAVLGPAAAWLHTNLKIRWSLACLTVIFALLLFNVMMIMIFFFSTSRLIQQLPSPTNNQQIIQLYLKLRAKIEAVSPVALDEQIFPPDPQDANEVPVIKYITEVTPGIARETANYFRGWAWTGIIILFTLLFVLLEGRMLTRRVVAIFGTSPEVQAKAAEVLRAMAAQVREYLVKRTVLNFGLAMFMGAVWYFSGLNQWLTWAALLLILNYIPYLGPIIAGAPPFVDGFLSSGPGTAIAVTIIFGLAILLEGYVLFPWYLGRSMDINATTVMLACLFWELVWGMTGLFLAVPIMAGIKAMLYEIPDGQACADLMGTSDEPSKPPMMPPGPPNGNGFVEAPEAVASEPAAPVRS